MREIFRSTILARVLRPLPLGFGLGWLVFAVIVGGLGSRHSAPWKPIVGMYVLVTFMGLVSLDVENGGLHLILTRRITRNAYLAGRLLAALCVGWVFSTLLVAMASGASLMWAHPSRKPTADEMLALLVATLADTTWQIVVLFFFSTFLPGRIDAFAYWLTLLALFLTSGLGAALDSVWLVNLADWMQRQLDNPLDSWVFGSRFWIDLLRFGSNVTLVVLAGALIFHRRQFSYAAG